MLPTILTTILCEINSSSSSCKLKRQGASWDCTPINISSVGILSVHLRLKTSSHHSLSLCISLRARKFVSGIFSRHDFETERLCDFSQKIRQNVWSQNKKQKSSSSDIKVF